MKINLFDKLVEFVHVEKLGEDVLLFLAILRLKHARRDVWRVDGLQHNRFCNRISSFPISYNNKPSEFLGQDESFDCSPFSNGQQYRTGLYFTQLLIHPAKFVAFLFTIEGSKVELKKYLVFDPSEKSLGWAKLHWSINFWDEIEKYHKQPRVPELKGHRVLGKYMMFPDDEQELIKEAFLDEKMSDKLADSFRAFPSRYFPTLLELAPVFTRVGVDIHNCNSSVFFLFLTAMATNKLKATAQRIQKHRSHTLLLISNDSDIDDNLMNTGHCYNLIHLIDVCEYSHLYFYLVTKLR